MKISSLFSDHMVLQNGETVPVWGFGKKGEEITVTYTPAKSCKNKSQVKKTKLKTNGRWQVELDALQISFLPAEIKVKSSNGDSSTAKDVLVGEVWLASGQSNMEWRVDISLNPQKEIASANWPNIRMFTVPRVTSYDLVESINSQWDVCSPETVGKFSAVAYFFGREIHQTQKVPVGILNCAWGGTRIETWMSKPNLLSHETTKKEALDFEKTLASLDSKKAQKERNEFLADPIAWLRKRVVADPGNFGFEKGWADPKVKDTDWGEMNIPQVWQSGGVKENGVVWFRKWVEIPNNWLGSDVEITLGACDKHDVTYFNGEKIGSIGWELYDPWNINRKYTIPARLLKKGKNLITVRVYSYRNGGGLTGPAEEMYLKSKKSKKVISIVGNWKYKMEHNFGVVRTSNLEPANNPNTPHTLFNCMLKPLIPYGIRGFLWYQGESNAAVYEYYRSAFPQMIKEWRSEWGGRNLPFYFVQLANYISEGKWAMQREAQALALKEPQTGMAVTIDIGSAIDIHPKNKQEVGRRLSLIARKRVYGENKIIESGPLYRNHQYINKSIKVWFDYANGLSGVKKAKIKGFEIAGADQKFYPANVIVEGDSVVVSSSKVKSPVAVRYAWCDNPTCNLINNAGLPASPFRTDAWLV